MYSAFKLPLGFSLKNDTSLYTGAKTYCDKFKADHNYNRAYIQIEMGESDYYYAWCYLKKKIEYINRSYVDVEGKTSENTSYYDLYTGGEISPGTMTT